MSTNTILYVDDRPENLMLFEAMFSDKYEVICSTDPLEALDYVKGSNVRLVISDYMMPIMDGVVFLEMLKRDFPDIIRIMLTANTDPVVEMEARKRCGLFKFLLKPIDMRLVERTIDNALLINIKSYN